MSFVCRRCGNCCRWPGCVKLLPGETGKIAGFLGIPEELFIAEMTRISPDRQCLSLNEREDGSCIYFTSGGDGAAGCRIHPVKPRQCRDFPEHWNFPGWRRLCAGGGEE